MKRKKQKHLWAYITVGVAITTGSIVLLWALWQATPKKQLDPTPPKHTLPYVDGGAAVEQAQSFFDNYTKVPVRKDVAITSMRNNVVRVFGSQNLVFYKEYYRHGFDPIVCANIMPIKSTASLASTGPVATVNVLVEYPDGSKSTIVAKLLFGDNYSFLIDSITCPGDKGNLPPQS